MPSFFIDTHVGPTQCLDRIGTEFPNADEAIRTAFTALLDIVQDEDVLRTTLDIVVAVRDLRGTEIFHACLTSLRTEVGEFAETRHLADRLLRNAPAIGISRPLWGITRQGIGSRGS